MDPAVPILSDPFEEVNQASITKIGWGWWLIWLGILGITIAIIAWSVYYVHQYREILKKKCKSGNKQSCAQLVFNAHKY